MDSRVVGLTGLFEVMGVGSTIVSDGTFLAGVLALAIVRLLYLPSSLSGGPLVCIHHGAFLTICKRLRGHVHIGMWDRARVVRFPRARMAATIRPRRSCPHRSCSSARSHPCL